MNTLILRICITGNAMTNRWRLALCERGRYSTSCRTAGITAPVALRAAGFVDLHRRPRAIGAR